MDFIDFEGKGVGGPVKKLLSKNAELLFAPNVSDFYPMFSGLDVQGIGKKSIIMHNRIYSVWEDIIEKRRKQRTDISSPRDFLDALLDIGFVNDQINQLILELFSAGTDVTSSTIEWVMAGLLKNEDAMHKLRDELEQKIGKDTIIEWVMAKITFLLSHRALETCQVMGYTIPKDSQILANLWAIGRDPTTWPDPLTFKPERFLNSGLDFKGNDFEFTPFSAGRRICPGLPWAAKQVPLIIS